MILTRPLEDFRIWAREVVTLERDRKYEQGQSGKPHGLWFCASGVVWDLDYVRSIIPICRKTLPYSEETW